MIRSENVVSEEQFKNLLFQRNVIKYSVHKISVHKSSVLQILNSLYFKPFHQTRMLCHDDY